MRTTDILRKKMESIAMIYVILTKNSDGYLLGIGKAFRKEEDAAAFCRRNRQKGIHLEYEKIELI